MPTWWRSRMAACASVNVMSDPLRPTSLDHVALWVADRDAIADLACDHLGMHVIERTEKFTLVGADARRGKLTLFAAEGPREPGALVAAILRVSATSRRPSRRCPTASSSSAATTASCYFDAPEGLRLGLVQRETDLDYDLDHVVLRVEDADASRGRLRRARLRARRPPRPRSPASGCTFEGGGEPGGRPAAAQPPRRAVRLRRGRRARGPRARRRGRRRRRRRRTRSPSSCGPRAGSSSSTSSTSRASRWSSAARPRRRRRRHGRARRRGRGARARRRGAAPREGRRGRRRDAALLRRDLAPRATGRRSAPSARDGDEALQRLLFDRLDARPRLARGARRARDRAAPPATRGRSAGASTPPRSWRRSASDVRLREPLTELPDGVPGRPRHGRLRRLAASCCASTSRPSRLLRRTTPWSTGDGLRHRPRCRRPRSSAGMGEVYGRAMPAAPLAARALDRRRAALRPPRRGGATRPASATRRARGRRSTSCSGSRAGRARAPGSRSARTRWASATPVRDGRASRSPAPRRRARSVRREPATARSTVHVAAAVTTTLGGLAVDADGPRGGRRVGGRRRHGRHGDRRLLQRAGRARSCSAGSPRAAALEG